MVAVTGADRLRFLHAVCTQQLTDLDVGRWRSALLLDPHGNPEAVWDTLALQDRVLLICPEEVSDRVVALGERTFLADAVFAPTELAVVWIRGPEAHAVAAAAGWDAPSGTVIDGDPVRVGRDDGVDLCTATPDAVLQRLVGVRRVDVDGLEAWRIAHGIPAWGREITRGRLPEELGLLPTHVHLDKGCYPGQEAVARMWNLGRPRRRLAAVEVEGAVSAGQVLDTDAGRVEVTSVTDWQGRRVGLALVPPSAAAGTELVATEGRVVVRWLVGEGLEVPGARGARPAARGPARRGLARG